MVWVKKGGANHFLDCLMLADAAADATWTPSLPLYVLQLQQAAAHAPKPAPGKKEPPRWERRWGEGGCMAFSSTDQHESGHSASRVANPRTLHGMKAICVYIGKSENTVCKYIRQEGLPAVKIGGEWVSDEGRIDEWRLNKIG